MRGRFDRPVKERRSAPEEEEGVDRERAAGSLQGSVVGYGRRPGVLRQVTRTEPVALSQRPKRIVNGK